MENIRIAAAKFFTAILLSMLVMMLIPLSLLAADVASDFSLVDVKGTVVDMARYKGKVIFLAFWAPWCVPCREELPELDTLYKKYHGKGFEVIGVSIRTSESSVAGFLRKSSISFPVLVDKNSDVSDAYGVSRLPESVIIDRDGIIRHRHRGFGKEFLPAYEKEISDLLKQQ
jgi:peroxiredoxin